MGGVVPDTAQVHLALKPGTRLRVDGIDARVRHRVQMGRHQGLPLTSPGQTFHDLAEDLDLVDLVVVGDSLVPSGLVSLANLERAATQLSGPGTKGAGRAVAYVRPGVDSAMESRLRLLLVLAGLPEPIVNLPIRDEVTGRVLYRIDLAYPAMEDRHRIRRSTARRVRPWHWDVQRREELERDGWRLVVVLSGDVYRAPARTLARVVDAVSARGGRVAVRGETWQRHFPGTQ
jgi:hypothetical protein